MSDLLREALLMRKKRLRAKAGLESEDIKEKRMISMGEGVSDEILERGSNRTNGSSTDELSPSRAEQRASQVDDYGYDDEEDEDDEDEREAAGKEVNALEKDMSVFDEREYRQIKKKNKPNGLLERVQLSIGDKLLK